MAAGGAEIAAVAKDAITFEGEAAPLEVPGPTAEARTGSGDKAAASDDWVPDAWREEL
jgi:hypothetical protein